MLQTRMWCWLKDKGTTLLQMLVNTLPAEQEQGLLTYRSQLIITDGVIVACTSRQHKGYEFWVRQVCLISLSALHVVPAV
jgi:hypothetical protein